MTNVASVYAQALYDLSRDERLSGEILEQMKQLRTIFAQSSEYVKLLCAPNLSKEERCALIDEAFSGQVHIYVLNFLKILTEKGYMRQFVECCDVYRTLYNEDHGILLVKVTTAAAMSAQQSARLQAKLARITGKTVELSQQIDPACLGGVRLDYDGKRIEDTVRGRLDELHGLLKNTML